MRVLDTDPLNESLSKFESIRSDRVQLLSDDKRTIPAGNYDRMFEYIISSPGDVIIDSGSSANVQLDAYLGTERADEVLYAADCNLILHVPIVGGENRADTLSRLEHMLESIPNCCFVVWINNYFGKVFNESEERLSEDDVVLNSFEDTTVYKNYTDKIMGIIELPQFPQDTKGKTLSFILNNLLTFNDFDGIELNKVFNTRDGELQINMMQRLRRKFIYEDLWGAMSPVLDSLEELKENPLPFIERESSTSKSKEKKKKNSQKDTADAQA